MTTTVHRIHNFSAGPAVSAAGRCSRKRSATSLRCPASGCRCSRSATAPKTFEDILARTEADLRRLGNVPASHKVLFLQGGASHAVLDGADEPAHAGTHRRLHRHRRLGAEGREGSAARWQRQHRRDDRGRELLTHSAAGRAEAHRRMPPTSTSRPTTRCLARSGTPSRRSATFRSSPTPPRTCSAGRSTSRNTV